MCYSLSVLFLLTVPANNTRGPRYMEKALAAIHQARLRHAVTLSYASSETQVGLFIQCHPVDRDTVLEPIIASYPHATISPMEAPPADCTNGKKICRRPPINSARRQQVSATVFLKHRVFGSFMRIRFGFQIANHTLQSSTCSPRKRKGENEKAKTKRRKRKGENENENENENVPGDAAH